MVILKLVTSFMNDPLVDVFARVKKFGNKKGKNQISRD